MTAITMNTDSFDTARRAQAEAVRRRARRLRARQRRLQAAPSGAAPALCPAPDAGSMRQRQGYAAEQRASAYLAAHGMRILARNLRCKAGEIDLVGRDRHVLVFVEVRARRDARFGGAAASVNRRKQEKLIRAAQYFLPRLSARYFAGRPPVCRFDVVCLQADGLAWLKNAFPS
jgi:putative endonuclease